MLILAPIITLSIVIFMHELGHFIAARLNKVKVEDFSIGFGPKIFSFKRKDTQYSLRMIPFGGFNRMAGEEYNENKPITEDMFIAKPIKNRLSIIAAGPLGNLISGFFICILGFLIGIKTYTLPAKIDK
jgi:regulator of sigma E protease